MSTLYVLILCFLATPTLAADGGGDGLYHRTLKKAAEKTNSRWTLEDWLAQKERNHLMDLWLGMNMPSPYEYYLGGYYLSETSDSNPQERQNYLATFGAYAYIVGIEGQYENNSIEGYNDTTGIFHLRILGNAYQSTNFTLQGGLRSRQGTGDTAILRQTFAGASMTLYLLKKFGLHGDYKSFLPATNDLGHEVTGSRIETGAFIEFELLRIYGSWIVEDTRVNAGGSPEIITTDKKKGFMGGVLVFF